MNLEPQKLLCGPIHHFLYLEPLQLQCPSKNLRVSWETRGHFLPQLKYEKKLETI